MLQTLFLNLREYQIEKKGVKLADQLIPSVLLQSLDQICENASFQLTTNYFDFAAAGYTIDKQGRWHDPNTGKFVSKPSVNDPSVQDYIKGELTAGNGNTVQNLLGDIKKLKLLNLSTTGAYKAAVEQLKKKYKNSPFGLSLITALQLDRGVSNKSNTADSIQKLEGLITNSITQPSIIKPALKYDLRDIQLKEIPVSHDTELAKLAGDLNSVDINKLTDSEKAQLIKDKAALNAVLQYRQSVDELNGIVSTVNSKPSLDHTGYENLYDGRNLAWKKMKDALDASQDLKDNYLSEPILDEYMKTMCQVSREAPGGYKIVVPKDEADVKAKAATLPC